MTAPPYWPFYCEENIWRLVGDLRDGPARLSVLIVTNTGRRVAIWNQAAAARPGEPVIWDYHVVLAAVDTAGAMIWDLDSMLARPAPFDHWVQASFRSTAGRPPDPFDPLFRVVDADVYRARFTTDRSHMRRDGKWLKSPPPWEPPGAHEADVAAVPLALWLDLHSDAPGSVVGLDRLDKAIGVR